MKKFYWLVALVLGIIFIAVCCFIPKNDGLLIWQGAVMTEKISVNGDEFNFSGKMLISSIYGDYKSFKYRIKEDKLYLWLYADTILDESDMEIKLDIKDDRIEDVEEVYLCGREDTKLLWKRAEANKSEKLKDDIEDCGTVIPIENTDGISAKAARDLCLEHIGSVDDESFPYLLAEHHTGRYIGYVREGALKYKDKDYYIMRMMWTADGDSYWSTIGELAVSTDGAEIIEILKVGDGIYRFSDVLWEKELEGII